GGSSAPPCARPAPPTATTVLTIQLAPLAAGLTKPSSMPGGTPLPAFAIAAGLLVFVRRKQLRKSLRLAVVLIAFTSVAVGLMGCSGGFLRPPSTPPGNYTVTITGTSGSTVQSATVTVVVR